MRYGRRYAWRSTRVNGERMSGEEDEVWETVCVEEC